MSFRIFFSIMGFSIALAVKRKARTKVKKRGPRRRYPSRRRQGWVRVERMGALQTLVEGQAEAITALTDDLRKHCEEHQGEKLPRRPRGRLLDVED